jgi:hypothetical protein
MRNWVVTGLMVLIAALCATIAYATVESMLLDRQKRTTDQGRIGQLEAWKTAQQKLNESEVQFLLALDPRNPHANNLRSSLNASRDGKQPRR